DLTNLLTSSAAILPPYHLFRVEIDTQTSTSSTTTGDTEYSYFHTEGPPTDLTPYVAWTVPEDSQRPFYRDYRPGLRANETYLDLLYKQSVVSADGTLTPVQFLQIQILDSAGNPVRDDSGAAVSIETRWDEAPDHLVNEMDAKWLDMIRAAIPTFDTGLL